MSVETIILTSQKDVPPLVLLHLAPPVSRQVLGAVVQDSQNLTKKKRGSSWHCSSSQFNKDIPNSHRCSTHFWKMWIWHNVHSTEFLAVLYENLFLGKETTATHHLKTPTLKQVAGSKKSNSSPATYLSHSPKNSRSLLFAGVFFNELPVENFVYPNYPIAISTTVQLRKQQGDQKTTAKLHNEARRHPSDCW